MHGKQIICEKKYVYVDLKDYNELIQSRDDWGDIHCGSYSGSPELIREFYGNIHCVDEKNCKFFTMIRRRRFEVNRNTVGYLLGCNLENVFYPKTVLRLDRTLLKYLVEVSGKVIVFVLITCQNI